MPDKESRKDTPSKPFSRVGRRDVLKTTAVAVATAGGVSASATASSGPPSPPVIEDFERDDPLAEYGGADDVFSVASDGDESVLMNDSGTFASAVSTSGLNEYPERGDEIHVLFDNASDDNFVSFHLFAQAEEDAPDGYSVGISGQGELTIWGQENGDIDALASEPLSDQISGWYRVEVSTDETTISADLYDDSSDDLLASVAVDDDTYSSGGIGFRSAGNGERWNHVVGEFDVDDIELEVTVDDVEHPEEVVVDIDLYSDDDWIYEADDGIEVTVGEQTQTDDLLVGSHNVYEFTFEKDEGTHDWSVEVEAETRRESFEDDPEPITGQTLTDDGAVEVEEGDGDPTPGDETIFLDFDAATSLEDPPASYDRVHDTRGTGNYAELGGLIEGTVHDDTHIQFTASDNSSSGSKSSNTTVELWHDHRVGYIPQEVYFEVDLYLGPEYYLDGTDTDRWGWVMNRYDGNDYGSNDGDGFSNAFGTTPRGNPPSGTYAFFSYAYDSTNTGTTGNFIEHIDQNPNAYIPVGEWVTFAGYCKCNDIGQSNAVQTFYRDGEEIAHRSGFQTSASSQNDWCSEVGMLGYYIDSGGGTSIDSNKERHFDNHRIWVDDDIPDAIRE